MNPNEKDQLIQSLQTQIQELQTKLEDYSQGGIKILFSGKANAQRVARKVKPRTLREMPELSVGSEEQKTKNLVIEGDNLLALSTLYQYHGKIDLIIADPPYNTGKDFRYNDRWDQDPNDPGLGDYVKADDPSRHTKWMKFMLPRCQMIRQMLKNNGVFAICIDERELFRLGMMLDEIFGENNRIAIINWQKAYAPKSQSKHISSATEYVLVYAKNKENTKTRRLGRSEKQDKIYSNPDNDPRGFWSSGDASVIATSKSAAYAIQNPFTGGLFYPPATCTWRIKKPEIKRLLEEWGSEYEERDLKDGYAPALVLKGAADPEKNVPTTDPIVQKANKEAQAIYKRGQWPKLIFLKEGMGQIRLKRYLSDLLGVVSTTYWASEDFSLPELGSISLPFTESGHSQAGVRELNAATGYSDDKFVGVKPLKLFTKIIQLWCPPNGLVLDPFAGSGTTGHAVLQLNKETGSDRSFILIESGNPENGDNYCRTLLQKRLQAAITGKWADQKAHEPLGGGFKFTTLDKQINNQAILQMERTELIDTIIASRIDKYQQKYQGLQLLKSENCRYLIAKNSNQEGFFLIWDGPNQNVNFTKEVYQSVVQEAQENNLRPPYHVYARLYLCQTERVIFHQIPNSILLDFGFDLEKDQFN